ncbi:EF-hand domain-containing protein, partial [Haematococcus lacustris]
DVTLELLSSFQDRCRCMDITRAAAAQPQDKLRIIAEIKHTVGLNRMHRLLPESLMRSARAGLRWGGSLCRISMYCAILLKNNEQAQAQALLHAIPEIHDDEKTLQDIRDVFKVYDTDGSGELDRDEFVEVLGVAGFTSDEAHSIFGKVDTDGGGSVSLVEFEKWWIESQRQQSTRYQHGVELTLDALLVNLKAMIALLERQQLHSHVAFYHRL